MKNKLMVLALALLAFSSITLAQTVLEDRAATTDLKTINGLEAYNLSFSQSSDSTFTQAEIGNGGLTVEYGIRAWIRNSSGGRTELTGGSPEAIVTRSANGEGLQSAALTVPTEDLSREDAIETKLYLNIGGNGWGSGNASSTFITERLDGEKLNAADWTINYYSYYDTVTSGPKRDRYTRGRIYWGSGSYNTSINNINYTEFIKAPGYRNLNQNSSRIESGKAINLSVEAISEEDTLDSAILSTNESGVFENKSIYGSPLQLSASGSYELANFTWSNSSVSEQFVGWRVWIKDSLGQFNRTNNKVFEVIEPVSDFRVLNPGENYSRKRVDDLTFNTTWDTGTYNVESVKYEFNDSNRNETVQAKGDYADYAYTNTSFKGVLGYRAYAFDSSGGLEFATSKRAAEIFAGVDVSNVDVPAELTPGTIANVTCSLTENKNGNIVTAHPVEFTVNGNLNDTAQTDSNGETKFSYVQNETGTVELGCRTVDDESRFLLKNLGWKNTSLRYTFGSTNLDPQEISVTRGYVEGSKSDLSNPGNLLYWRKLNDTENRLGARFSVNTSTDIPEKTVDEIEINWTLRRVVQSMPEEFDESGDGTISFSNGDINSTWFYDSEYSTLQEVNAQANDYSLSGIGFKHVMPEDESNVALDKLEIKMDAEGFNLDGTNGYLELAFVDQSTGDRYVCGRFESSSRINYTCEVNDSAALSAIPTGNNVSVRFQSAATSTQQSWDIYRISVDSYYADLQDGANKNYLYELGVFNYTEGQLTALDTINISGSLKNLNTKTTDVESVFGFDGVLSTFLTYYQQGNPFPSFRQHRFTVDVQNISLSYRADDVKELDIDVKDSQGNSLKSNYSVFRGGEKIDAGTGAISEKLAKNQEYTIKQDIEYDGSTYKVSLNRFNVSETVAPGSRLLDLNVPDNLITSNETKFYALNGTNLDLENATISVPKKDGGQEVIVHCTSFDFSTDSCNNWEVNQISEYQTAENSNYFKFNVSSFSAFGTGNGEPLPNITEVRIYNLSEGANSRQGGNLLVSGLNETFKINQSDSETRYRFEFDIRNEGSLDWNIGGQDQMRHRGLNKTWGKEDIYYNISGVIYGGGSKSGDVMTWDTANGGTLNSGEKMTAAYVVNTSTKSSNFYDMDFLVNDTSDNAGSQDFHELNKTKFGFLNITLLEPPLSFSAQQNSTFTVNASIGCEEGKCGNTSVSTRYNATSASPDTLISTSDTKPFYIIGSENTKNCGRLGNNEECQSSWEVNATGDKGSQNLIDVNSSSDISQVERNSSQNSEVTIVESLILEIDWNKVDFGAVKPGENNNPARGNYNLAYNVTIPENSKSASAINVSGTHLNNSRPDDYYINISEVGFSQQNDTSMQTQLSEDPKTFEKDVPSGTTLNSFYWIDIKQGIKSDTYSGVITFEAYS